MHFKDAWNYLSIKRESHMLEGSYQRVIFKKSLLFPRRRNIYLAIRVRSYLYSIWTRTRYMTQDGVHFSPIWISLAYFSPEIFQRRTIRISFFFFFNYLVSAVGTRQRISVEIPYQTISNSGRLPPTPPPSDTVTTTTFPFPHSTWLPSVPTACSPTHITTCSSTWHGSTRPVCQENPASYFEVHPKSLREDMDCWTFSQTNAVAYAKEEANTR